MQEPRIHSAINPVLPEEHWLLDHWREHSDPTVENPNRITCETCGRHIYDLDEGTLISWVETGRVVNRHGHEEPQTSCLFCFASRSGTIGVMLPMYALTDEGGPQPIDTEGESPRSLREEEESRIAAEAQLGVKTKPRRRKAR